MSTKCIVCGKDVAYTDQTEHLATSHLGPHYFWFDAQRFKSEKPSAMIKELKLIANISPGNQAFLEVPGATDRAIGDSENVDLTREPHLWAAPPATMLG